MLTKLKALSIFKLDLPRKLNYHFIVWSVSLLGKPLVWTMCSVHANVRQNRMMGIFISVNSGVCSPIQMDGPATNDRTGSLTQWTPLLYKLCAARRGRDSQKGAAVRAFTLSPKMHPLPSLTPTSLCWKKRNKAHTKLGSFCKVQDPHKPNESLGEWTTWSGAMETGAFLKKYPYPFSAFQKLSRDCVIVTRPTTQPWQSQFSASYLID